MNVFLDATILISVLNKEYPTFTYSARILSLIDSDRYRMYTSPLCLAIAFYFAEKKHGPSKAIEKLYLLASRIAIAENTQVGVKSTINNPSINDFEDGLEYYAAIEADCKCIVTEDVGDFYFSDIEILTSVDFFQKYLRTK